MARRSSRYHLIIEDRNHLERVCDISLSPLRMVLGVLAVCIGMALGGLLLVWVTPLHTILPGHIDAEGRARAEEALIRLDSLHEVLNRNSAYLATMRQTLADRHPRRLAPRRFTYLPHSDSFPGISETERRFMADIGRRRRYDLSVIGKQTARGMVFSPPATDCVVTPLPGRPYVARIIMALGQPVGAPADGRVVASFYDPASGWTIVIQHPKGFVSRYSRLGRPLVEVGDMVTGSQIIALTSEDAGRQGALLDFELWFDGTPLRPYPYIMPSRQVGQH
ncbi:MAG: M23 family metallopeptidase [Muribaculaceae bacterium]|nr:M23 family metallopeptidase [Muribaculaceae bacterium]